MDPATVLGAWRMWLASRREARADPGPALEALREENAQLRSDLESRLAELEDRVDFAERRLVQEGPPERLPGPPARTPV